MFGNYSGNFPVKREINRKKIFVHTYIRIVQNRIYKFKMTSIKWGKKRKE